MRKRFILYAFLLPMCIFGQVFEKDIFGNTVIKSTSGHAATIQKKDIFENSIFENGEGKFIRKISKDIFGNIIIEGDKSELLLKIGEDIFGNLVIQGVFDRKMNQIIIHSFYEKIIDGNGKSGLILKDSNGKTVREVKKDIFNNYIISDEKGNNIRTITKNIFNSVEVMDQNRNVIMEVTKDISVREFEYYVFDELDTLDDVFVKLLVRKMMTER